MHKTTSAIPSIEILNISNDSSTLDQISGIFVPLVSGLERGLARQEAPLARAY